MAVIGASMLGALAAKAASKLIDRVTQPRVSFSEALARAVENAQDSPADQAREAEINRLAQQLLSLPLTSDEARALAAEIVGAAEKARAEGGPDVSRRIEKAVSRVVASATKQLRLSARDTATLAQAVQSYTEDRASIS